MTASAKIFTLSENVLLYSVQNTHHDSIISPKRRQMAWYIYMGDGNVRNEKDKLIEI